MNAPGTSRAGRPAGGGAYRAARGDRAIVAFRLAKPGIAFANGALVLFPLVADGVFHVGETGLGLLYAARGLGVLFGPLLLGGRGRSGSSTWWVLAGGTNVDISERPEFDFLLDASQDDKAVIEDE